MSVDLVSGSVSTASRRRSTGFTRRLAWGLYAGLGCAGLVVFVAAHALGPLIALALLALPAAVIAAGERRGVPLWLAVVPGLAPVADLALWTGQIQLTESDALVLLAIALGGLARALATGRPDEPVRWRFGPLQWLVLLPMLASYLLSTDWSALGRIGVDPALSSGYASPLNGPRLAKGFLLALLLLPLLLSSARMRRAGACLAGGLLAGLFAVSIVAGWERWAFPGLSDFSADYRTVALFWETNVGGAQLDGWLALSLPFLLWALIRERSNLRLLLLGALGLLAGYVTFTTFSRGLYAGAVLGCGLTGLLMARGLAGRLGWGRSVAVATAFAVVLAVAGSLLHEVFASGGYRGMAATAGVFGLAALLAHRLAAARVAHWLAGLVLAMVLGAIGLVLETLVPKGAYLNYLLAFAAGLGIALRPMPRAAAQPTLAVACLGWAAAAAVVVGMHWAPAADHRAAMAAGGLALVGAMLAARLAAGRAAPGVRMAVATGATLASLAVVVVAANSYYAGERMSTIATDLQGRLTHWRAAASLVGPQERLLGIGTGEFAERFLLTVPPEQMPGGHALASSDGRSVLQLLAPRHVLGHGELYRVTQRIAGDFSWPLQLSFVARARGGDGALHAEVCAKHVLYPSACAIGRSRLQPDNGWARGEITLVRNPRGQQSIDGRPWALSLASVKPGSLLEVDELSLTDANGRELLGNAGFAEGSDFWFFSSDRHHLPWHAKSLLLHYWVEQGWLGFGAFMLLLCAAMLRLLLAGAAKHPLAPPLAGGLTGMMAVGTFDSLVDAPRLTTLVFLLLFVALGLRPEGAGRQARRPGRLERARHPALDAGERRGAEREAELRGRLQPAVGDRRDPTAQG